ncbi:hypothetical protein [Paracoccus sp. (in: a-proteobacteria)]|uniref:hypothetical protein n=1 Tax=Paracoccus sp. TaxID=267 RepID=UPI003A850FD3
MQLHGADRTQETRANNVAANLNAPISQQPLKANRPELSQALGGVLSSVVAGLGQGAKAPDPASSETAAPGPMEDLGEIWEDFKEWLTGLGKKDPPKQGGKNLDKAEKKALEGIEKSFGPEVAELAGKSPTLREDLVTLEQEGWTVHEGDPGGGSYADRTNRDIVIDPDRSATDIVRSIAHEAGHAKDNTPADMSSREAYVDSALTGEGRATINNIRVQREIIETGGPDIGISGANGETYSKIYDQAVASGDFEQGAYEIGQVFKNGEHTSTNGQSYGDYYGSFYDRVTGEGG